MNFLRFAVVFSILSLPVSAQSVGMTLTDGGMLDVPTVLLNNFTVIESNPQKTLIQGSSKSGQTVFVYGKTKQTTSPNRIRDALLITGIWSTLIERGLRAPQFVPITDTSPKDIGPRSVYRIDDPGGLLHDQLLYLITREDGGATILFLLMGPQNEFYSLSPEFMDMVREYQVVDFQIYESIVPWTLIAASILIFINLAFVWHGFYKLSHVREPVDV